MDPAVVQVGAGGLTAAEAADRLRRDGPNLLPSPPPVPAWRLLAGQFVHFFAAMLWAAGALAITAGEPQLGIAIFGVIVVNGVFAFVQEHRAERAAERLRDLLPRRATVVRDGEPHDVDASELVVGDLVLLGAGERISADLRVDESHGLLVDTSTLTGESVPSPVSAGEVVHAGTFVVEGESRAVAVATGASTRLAGIAALTRAGKRPPTPLARELRRVVRTIALAAVAVGVSFFLVSVALGTPATDGFIFAIGVTVALVPEGLLPTVTLSLAIGAERMARQHALVRRLEAVETLGSTTFICTDKTGTLTENRMAVVEVWTPAGTTTLRGEGYAPVATVASPGAGALAGARAVARAARRCSTGRAVERAGEWIAQGDPMEAAIDAFSRRLGYSLEGDTATTPDRRRFPFDPRRRRMSVVAGDELLLKGAPDAVLPLCSLVDGDDPSDAALAGAHGALDLLVRRGLRVIAVASRRLGRDSPAGWSDAEQNLTLLGLLAFEDPPRAGTSEAIASCRRAGIAVAMVTGDHPETARAIAAEVGLLLPGSPVLTGDDLPDDDDALGGLVDHDGAVVSRVAPEQKLRIALALRARGHVVAMTGDGVNDGPALQEADIGIAMGESGTDVAREAADLVLLDDNFATIVAAVVAGRATFFNVRRFLTYHLTDNVAELTPFLFWGLSGTAIPLALGVLQILALDLGTDTFPSLALGAEPPAPRTLDRPPVRGRLLDATVARRAFGVLGPTEAAMSMIAFFATFLAAGWRPGDTFPGGDTLLAASGAAFAAVVFGQMANAFACRSAHLPARRVGLTGNPLLIAAVVAELALLAALLFAGPLASLLDQAPPSLAGWAVVFLTGPAVLAADELDKTLRRARASRAVSPAA